MPVFLTVGLSTALKFLNNEHNENRKYLLDLRQTFLNKLNELTSEIQINFAPKNGHPGTVNLHFENVDADVIATRLGNELAISTAAACNGVGFEYSYVLKNMGLTKDIAKSSIRLCFSRQNKENEALEAANLIIQEYKFIRENL